jgi:hypothetical protein
VLRLPVNPILLTHWNQFRALRLSLKLKFKKNRELKGQKTFFHRLVTMQDVTIRRVVNRPDGALCSHGRYLHHGLNIKYNEPWLPQQHKAAVAKW